MSKEFGKIDISPSVIEDLSNEFSDEFAVINEIVANSYDAGATEFIIYLNQDENSISFVDNGMGMNKNNACEGFLKISHNKRNIEEYKKLKRIIMGRKGSGRIGLFSLCKKILVYSKKENDKPIAFYMNVLNILHNNKDINEVEYDDKYLDAYKTGTKIVISDFCLEDIFDRLNELNFVLYNNFFPIINMNIDIEDKLKMHIKIIIIKDGKNEEKIVSQEYNIFTYLDRFLNIEGFKIKEEEVKTAELKADKRSANGYDPNIESNKEKRIMNLQKLNINLSKECVIKTKENILKKEILSINKGWIGTLATIEESDNIKNYGIKVYSRNRLVIKDIRQDLKIDRFYLSYIVGDIFVDDLDRDEWKDITKISRNAYGGQDERYETVIKLVKLFARQLISEKSQTARKNKINSNENDSKTMKEFLDEAKRKFSWNNKKFKDFKNKALEEFKVKPCEDQKIIFISHKDFHAHHQPLSSSKNYNSFLFALFIVAILEQIKKIKGKDLNKLKIICSAVREYSMKNGNNIHLWLRDNGFNVNFYKNTLFYACIACCYIGNWNTDIEFGASWFSKENNTICLVDPKVESQCKPPINSELYSRIICEINEENNTIQNENITNWENFNSIFTEPLERIGIKVSRTEYDVLIKNKQQIYKYVENKFKDKRQSLIEEEKYMKI